MRDTRRTDLVLLIVAMVWGSSYLTAKNATEVAPVLVVLFLRYLLSALAGVPLVLALARRRRFPWTREEIHIGSVLGLTQTAVLVLEMYGVAHTSAANAGLLISLTLVITPLLDRSGGRGRVPPRFFLAAGVCVVAVGLLTSVHGLHTPGVGDVLMLAAAVVRAVHVALVGRLTSGRSLRPLQLTSVQTVRPRTDPHAARRRCAARRGAADHRQRLEHDGRIPLHNCPYPAVMSPPAGSSSRRVSAKGPSWRRTCLRTQRPPTSVGSACGAIASSCSRWPGGDP
ncbi:DMT family transporter [Streptomyces sp. NPDC001215]